MRWESTGVHAEVHPEIQVTMRCGYASLYHPNVREMAISGTFAVAASLWPSLLHQEGPKTVSVLKRERGEA